MGTYDREQRAGNGEEDLAAGVVPVQHDVRGRKLWDGVWRTWLDGVGLARRRESRVVGVARGCVWGLSTTSRGFEEDVLADSGWKFGGGGFHARGEEEEMREESKRTEPSFRGAEWENPESILCNQQPPITLRRRRPLSRSTESGKVLYQRII